MNGTKLEFLSCFMNCMLKKIYQCHVSTVASFSSVTQLKMQSADPSVHRFTYQPNCLHICT